MATDTTVDSAQAGAAEQQQVGGQESAAAAGNTGAPPTAAAPAPTFSAEQQAHIDKVVGDRLRRAQEKWRADQDAKAQAEADKVKAEQDAAEAKRQSEQGEWEALARKQETAATEAKTQVKELSAQLERANGVIAGLVESRKTGLPEAMVKALEGRDLYDQLQLVDAFLTALPAATTAAPTGVNGQQRQATQPTPQPQGRRELTAEERRAKARSTW